MCERFYHHFLWIKVQLESVRMKTTWAQFLICMRTIFSQLYKGNVILHILLSLVQGGRVLYTLGSFSQHLFTWKPSRYVKCAKWTLSTVNCEHLQTYQQTITRPADKKRKENCRTEEPRQISLLSCLMFSYRNVAL